jgi:membrane protein
VVGFLAPRASTFLALLAANKLLPSVQVLWRFAALGAAVSAILFETAKLAFARYVLLVLERYHSIYGAFGLVPLVLVWIYVGWLTVLLGVEMAHAAQRSGAIGASTVGRRRRGPDDSWDLVTGSTGARLMVEVARHFTSGAKATGSPDLAARLGLPEEIVQRVLGRLQEHDLVVEVEGDVSGWLPARPPSTIRLDEVFAAFRVLGDGVERDGRLGEVLEALDPAASERARVTLDELF